MEPRNTPQRIFCLICSLGAPEESYIVNLYRGISKLKLKINVNLPLLLCTVVSMALGGEFERFKITYSNSQRKDPPNRSNSPRRATETTIHNKWGRFTFILSFNLDIPRYKFTIWLFNVLPYISLYFEQTYRLTPCVGALYLDLAFVRVPKIDSAVWGIFLG